MHVLLVAQQLRRPVPGGIGTYVRGLVRGLDAVEDGPGVTLLASRPPGGRDGDGTDAVAALGRPLRTSRLPGPVLTRIWDRGLLAGPEGFDVVHAASLACPSARRAPLVVAVHDLAWRQVPETFPRRGRRWHDRALARAVRGRAVFAAPTQETADVLADAGVSPSAVRVLDPMYGCDHLPPADAAATAALLARFDVAGPYLLAVGTVEPRKNLPALVEAFVRARPRLPEPWPLVVVGPDGWGDDLRPAPGVVPVGAVPAPVLAGLYAGARCLAYVPLFEGFGLPAVEAMTTCTPVVASVGLPSTGAAALEVDPTDVHDIAEGLVVAAADDRRRAELVTAGLLRVGELTWAAAARRHVELWESLA